jgi:hypothetical protein
LEQVV